MKASQIWDAFFFMTKNKSTAGYNRTSGVSNVKIYLDMLFLCNTIMTMLSLSLLSRLTHRRFSLRRYVTASCLGGMGSLIVLLKPSGYITSLLIALLKAIMLVLVVITAGVRNRKAVFRDSIIYLVINLIIGGLCFLLCDSFGGNIIIIRNCTVYFNIPLLLLIICTIVTYLIISIYDSLLRFHPVRLMELKAVFTKGNISVTMPALEDTGALITDCFSGEPVVIFKSRRLFEYFELGNEIRLIQQGFHFVPYKTISGTSLMPVTLNARVSVIFSDGESKELRCAAGILDNDGRDRAILDPKIIC